MEKFYFSKAYDIRNCPPSAAKQRISIGSKEPAPAGPSITESRFRPWIVSTIITTEWARAVRNWEAALDRTGEEDTRVPTFIVIDEAHNLVPAETRDHSERGLREQLRRIAAEGRKFGLFLILVSQRPDKLDPLIVSECENRVVMKLGSPAVLSKTKEVLGLGHLPERVLERCLEFDVGRALIAGTWTNDNAVLLYGAARRTQEGGRNLKEKVWAQPVEDSETSQAPGAVAATTS
jgi:DNA helicase HerA-like ATPase